MKTDATLDPYETLGLARGASPDEIRRAFRRLAALHHPDRHGGSAEAEARFKLISAAFQRLKAAGWSLPRPASPSSAAGSAASRAEPSWSARAHEADDPDEPPYERPEFWPDGERIHYPTAEEIAALLRDEPALFPALRLVWNWMGYGVEYLAWFVIIGSALGLVGVLVWLIFRAIVS